MPETTKVAKNDLTKSSGHVGWVGDFEYFKNALGDLFRAHSSDVIDISTGARIGRFISTSAVADKMLAHLGLMSDESVRVASIDYENRRHEKIDRLADRAAGAAEAGKAALYSGIQMLRDIPLGQPILIGHHSERGDRSRRERAARRVDKGGELLKQAAFLRAQAAAAAGNDAISADDPLALQKLTEKLSGMKDRLEWMKMVNKYFRGGKLGEIGFKPEEISKLEKSLAEKNSWEQQPYPKYQIANLGGNIRRVETRLEELQLRVVEKPVTEKIGQIQIEENQELNRVQIRFPAKPNEEVRAQLSHFGFHWSREEMAWQAQRSPGNLYKAEDVATQIALGRLGAKDSALLGYDEGEILFGLVREADGTWKEECAFGGSHATRVLEGWRHGYEWLGREDRLCVTDKLPRETTIGQAEFRALEISKEKSVEAEESTSLNQGI